MSSAPNVLSVPCLGATPELGCGQLGGPEHSLPIRAGDKPRESHGDGSVTRCQPKGSSLSCLL